MREPQSDYGLEEQVKRFEAMKVRRAGVPQNRRKYPVEWNRFDGG